MGIVVISIASGVAGYLSRFPLAARFGSRAMVVFGLWVKRLTKTDRLRKK
jgi:hypothetical protein